MEPVTIETPQQMRAKYFPSLYVQEYKGQNDYLSYLASKGAALNPKLFPSVFHLKNGLPFIGMAVKQVIGGGQVLIRIPQQLILSSVKAVQQPLLRQVFKDDFFKNDEHSWEDRVLIVYSLFLLQQGDEKNPWYQMISRFPKQCDIACFWSEDQLDEFIDKTIKSAAGGDLKSFQTQWNEFQILKSKYQILQGGEYNKDNYRRVFINLTNRSFGKYISFASFVPMAELFNHHCSKVFYTVEKQKKNTFSQQNDNEEQTSSNGSNDSREYILQGEFDYDDLQIIPLKGQVQESHVLVPTQRQQVNTAVEKLFAAIQTELNWQDFSVIFAGHLFYLTHYISQEYLQGRKPFEKTIKQLQTISSTLESYKKRVQSYYLQVHKRPYGSKKQQKKKKQCLEYPLYEKQYESLILKTSPGDRIEKNNQIYFKYGRDSNRQLLMIYGFAIEGNKYQNFKLSFNISQIVGEYPGVLQKVVEKKLSLQRKFKLYNHRLNMDLILFFRLSNWMFYGEKALDEIFYVVNLQKEIAILQQICSILEQNVNLYQGDYDLTDKSLNYHQYFTRVYHKQKLTILQKQMKLFGLLIDILQRMSEGMSKEQAAIELTCAQRAVLKQYLQSIL